MIHSKRWSWSVALMVVVFMAMLSHPCEVVAQQHNCNDHNCNHTHDHNHGHSHGYDYGYGYPPTAVEAPRIRTEWGIGIGGAYTGIRTLSTSEVKLQPRFGFQGHIDMSVCFGRNFAIETEIAYEGGSLDVATEKEEHRVRTRTVDIPILLSLRMANGRLRLNAGPLFTVMSKAEYTSGGDVMLYGPVYPTWNVAGSIAIGLGKHFLLEARYVHALKDTHNQFGGVEFQTRPYKITAGVAIVF